jgi:hypothetical protein
MTRSSVAMERELLERLRALEMRVREAGVPELPVVAVIGVREGALPRLWEL